MSPRTAAVAALLLCCAVTAGCGLQSANAFIPPAEPGSVKPVESLEGVEITVGSKNFTEQLILGKMAGILLEVAGAEVVDKTNLAGSVATRQAQLSGDVEMNHQGGIRAREIDAGKFLPCCSTARTDMVIDA